MSPKTRRRFLQLTGLAAATAPLAIAQERRRRSYAEMIANDAPVAPAPLRPDPSTWSSSGITASWIGHATVLLDIDGKKIITDPVLFERIGIDMLGFFTLGPKRLVAPALTFDELPPIDLILLSHAHMDHLDIQTLRKFDRSIPVVVAQNTVDVIEDLAFQTVYELDWGEWANIGDIRVEAFEVKHFGWRYPWEEDRSRGNWNGRSYNAYLISRNGRHVVFGGDTAYHEKFTAIRDRGLDVDLAIMPIGAYDPWIRNHCNPEQALAMADQMAAKAVLPIHWSTFIQSEEPTHEPIERLRKAMDGRSAQLALAQVGGTWSSAVATASSPPAVIQETGGTR